MGKHKVPVIAVIAISLIVIGGIVVLQYFNRDSPEPLDGPPLIQGKDCDTRGEFFCLGLSVVDGKFILPIWKGNTSPMLVEEFLLSQHIPQARVNCSLNLSNLPQENMYGDNPGLLILEVREFVNLTLDCTTFVPSDLFGGVWNISARVSYPRSGNRSFPIEGFVRMKTR